MIDYEVMEIVSEIMAVSGLTSLLSTALGIACYILSGIALYSIAKRRGVNHTWMAWVPIVNDYLLGSISDHYRYAAKNEKKARRKALLTLNIIIAVACLAMIVMAIATLTKAISGTMANLSDTALGMQVMGYVLGILVLALVVVGVSIALVVVRFIALYDVYNSCDPDYSVLFLVLSIFIGITEPFFLFFSRKKDKGMPAGTAAPAAPRPLSTEVPWQTDGE